MRVASSAIATPTLVEAFAVRHALRTQLGSGPWEDVLAIARDPRPEVIAAQNSIWLCTWIPMAFRLIQREESSLARECSRILSMISDVTAKIQRVDNGELFRQLPDTLEEARGER